MMFRILNTDYGVIVLLVIVLSSSTATGQFPRSQKLPEAVQLKADVPYADTKNRRQQLDILLPQQADSKRPLPVVVYIHGGAWLAGNRAAGHRRLAHFVATGNYAGISRGFFPVPASASSGAAA